MAEPRNPEIAQRMKELADMITSEFAETALRRFTCDDYACTGQNFHCSSFRCPGSFKIGVAQIQEQELESR